MEYKMAGQLIDAEGMRHPSMMSLKIQKLLEEEVTTDGETLETLINKHFTFVANKHKRVYVKDMDRQQLKSVWINNPLLREECWEDFTESRMDWVSIYLGFFTRSLSDWSIGFNQKNYIDVRDRLLFVQGVRNLSDQYTLLSDEGIKNLELAQEKYDEHSDCDYQCWDEEADDESDLKKKADRLKTEYNLAVDRLIQNVLDALNAETDDDDTAIENYFFEFYAESRLSEEAYVTGKEMILYEDHPAKCYA